MVPAIRLSWCRYWYGGRSATCARAVDGLLLMFPVLLYPLLVEGGISDVLEYGVVL
jgi:hypothetical protein